ncbi:MAG: PAS domain S-box protein [Burkholderiales bacterium]|nr:PAS domain S-box protein [Gallionella sp.]
MNGIGRKSGKDRSGAKYSAGAARSRAGSKRGEQRLTGIIASIANAVMANDERHEIVLVGPAAEQMFAFSEAQLLGKPVSMLTPERYREAHDAHIRDFAHSKVANRSMGRFGQFVGLRADRREFRIDALIAQAEQAGERLYTVTLCAT